MSVASELLLRTLDFEFVEGAVTKIRAQQTVAWRTLPFAFIAHVAHGRAVVEFEDRSITQEPGEAVIVPQNIPHRIINNVSVVTWIHFRLGMLHSIDLPLHFGYPRVIKPPQSKELGRCCEELIRLRAGSTGILEMLQWKVLGYQLALKILQAGTCGQGGLKLIEDVQRFAPALNLMQERMMDPLEHAQLARTMNLSPSRFHALFRQAFEKAPMAYLQQVRLEKAKILLLSTSLAVREVSLRVGYPDPYHFCRLFRKYAGFTPRDYRKNVATGF